MASQVPKIVAFNNGTYIIFIIVDDIMYCILFHLLSLPVLIEKIVHCANFLVARHSTSLLCLRANPLGRVKLGPTAVSMRERCLRGKARGNRVGEEESQGDNEIEALHEFAMPFVPVHRGEARANSDVDVQAVYEGEGWKRRSRRGGELRR
ncbi:hypothetical protein Syun_003112 [Stephania yunnanensis]|uniref:Uncharacterized protein n=1 Tax=Stephania yunnanensis TaxID=152371 RepID=A0AAP0L373_9MAGN